NLPAQITLPNLDGLPAGNQVDIWALDPVSGQFGIVGTGRVDGATISTLTGGITSATLVTAAPPVPAMAASGDDNADILIPSPLNEGNLQRRYSVPGYVTLGGNRTFTLVYNSTAADPEPIVAADATIIARAAVPGTLESHVEVG